MQLYIIFKEQKLREWEIKAKINNYQKNEIW